MADRSKADWWYGANASFPRAVEWRIWFEHWKDQYEASQPRDKFLVDATMKLQQTYIKIAQQVRKNLGWVRQFTEGEMRNILDVAEEAESWFKRNQPREDVLASCDPRFVFMVKALEGAYSVAHSLAQELDQINRKGFVMIDTSSEAHELLA